jgi:hypothetical protein
MGVQEHVVYSCTQMAQRNAGHMQEDIIAGFTSLLKGDTPKDIVLKDTWVRDDYGAFCC